MSYVYFALTDYERGRAVKIGFTRLHPYDRCHALQLGCPSEIDCIAYAPGDASDERRLHDRFADFAIHREWFRFEGELAAYIFGLNDRSEKFQPAPSLYPLPMHS